MRVRGLLTVLAVLLAIGVGERQSPRKVWQIGSLEDGLRAERLPINLAP